MNRLARTTTLLLLGCISACKQAATHDEHEHDDEHELETKAAPPHRPATDMHANEGLGGPIHVTNEALELAGITIGVAEKRALAGGVAIPAEVQFEPSSTAHVGPLVPGRITKVTVALGDSVKAGQLLAVVASNDVSAARARLAQAQAQLTAAESTVARQQQLAAEGIGAQRSLIDAQARANELRAEVAGLRSQLSLFGSGSGGGLSLIAPIDGIIVALHGTLGETASPQQPVFIVTDPTKVWVRGNVPELQIARALSGSAAVVRLHAFPELAMPGAITYVAPAIDERTRSLPVRVKLDHPDPRLKSGLFGTIELVGGADERVVAVPVDAVATLDGQSVVFVPAHEPGAFRPAPVAVGRRAGGFFEVRSGLTEGTRIVVSGAFTLKSILRSGDLSEGHEH